MTVSYQVIHAVRRAIALGILGALGAGIMAANAKPAPAGKQNDVTASQVGPAAPAPATLQRVLITGSLIRQIGTETPNPVQLISKAQLVQSGYTNLSDILRNISANGMGTLSQSFSAAFASGGAGVALRGLTVGDTLTLIDGEQSVPYPLLDDGEREFVDVSSIPFTAVSQVQILKDGGSALYGSNAIAGTVNIILRKQYQGFEVSASSGTSSHWDGTTEHVGFIGGEGHLSTDGYNWYLSGDFRHQDQILAGNRSGLWDTLNFTPWGGYNVTPGANPTEDPNVAVANSSTGYLINPNTASGQPYYFFPGCSASLLALDKCTYGSPNGQLQPSSTNIDLLGKFTKELGNGWEAGVQVSWFDSRSEEQGPLDGSFSRSASTYYPTGFSLVGLSPYHPPVVNTYPVITVPANYAPGGVSANPFGAPAPLVYAFPELGPPTTKVNTNTYRLLASLSGTLAGWRIKATAGAMYAKMALRDTAQIEPAALQTALNNGYVLGSPAGQSLFAPTWESTPTSNMDLIDIHGTHKLLELPGGPLSLAVGVQWIKEGNNDVLPYTVAQGIQTAMHGVFFRGNEYDRAVFAELQGNPVKQLTIDAQARYDNYQTFGSRISPNFGIKFTPWQWVALRGTWGEGFRAPSVAEGISSGETFGEGTIPDPILCPTAVPTGKVAGPGDFASQCSAAVTGVLSANPHLQDVTSTNWTAGLILQPIPQFSASVDYYNIKVKNDIVGGLSLLSGFTQVFRGPQISLPFCPASFTSGCTTSQLTPELTPVGTITAESFPYVNASATHVSGFDVDLKYHWSWGRLGQFTGEATWTHELTYQISLAGVTYELAGTQGPSSVSGDTGNPKDRFNVRLAWRKGPVTITPSVNFVGHFSIIDPSSGYNTCGEALSYNGNFASVSSGAVPASERQFCTVGYFLETNVYASYQINGSLQVHASVRNLFDKQPPMDVMTYGSGTYFYPYDAALAQDGAVGRFMTVGVTYNVE